MKQEFICKKGAIEELPLLLKNYSPKKIFIVSGKNSFAACGAKEALERLLKNYNQHFFTDFSPNPTLPDALKGIKAFLESEADLIIAVGGGSAIDMAKLINVGSCHNEQNIQDVFIGKIPISKVFAPLIAIPTTAGSGSEATHFAVVYVNDEKYSVAHQSIRPIAAIIEPLFLTALPEYQKACTAADALCQAIESYWAVSSSEESRQIAKKAIEQIVPHITEYVKSREYKPCYEKMAKAAYLAGQAINLTKTTAPHAMSYVLTSKYGLPHGHAVALSLGQVLKFNYEVNAETLNDSRGIEFVKDRIREICIMLNDDENSHKAADYWSHLMESIGLKMTFRTLNLPKSSIEDVKENINQTRVKNNPVMVDKDSVLNLFSVNLTLDHERPMS